MRHWPRGGGRGHDEEERRQLGVCSSGPKRRPWRGPIGPSCVTGRAGFSLRRPRPAPPRVAAAVRAEGFPAEGAPDLECHSLVFLDAVHCPGECPAVPESYRDVGAADELGSLADLRRRDRGGG